METEEKELGAKKEGDSPLEEKETPSDSPTETKPTEEPQPEEGEEHTPTAKENIPWHKDPRWKAWQEEKKTLESQVEELSSFKEKVEPLLTNITPKEESIPSYWNGDAESYRMFKADQERIVEERHAKWTAEQQVQQQEYNMRLSKANQWLEENINELKAEGHKVNQEKLLKFTMDNNLVDQQGQWNYRLAQEMI